MFKKMRLVTLFDVLLNPSFKIDRSFKICKNWKSLHNDKENLNPILLKMHIHQS